jgi:hypothetical protein
MADPPGGDPGGDPTNSHDTVMRSPSQGPSPPAELRRITRGYLKRQRNSLNSFTATKRTPIFEFTGRNDENDTSLDDVLGLIADLKKIIIEQGNTIENAKADLAEIKSQQENLKIQNNELQDEIRSLRTQLSAYSGSIPSGSVPSPRSWASVAASGGTARTETSLSGLTRTENLNKEPNCVRISTQPEPANSESTGATFTRYLPTDSANSYIRNALLNADATKDVQVAGVGTTKTGYVIRFQDHQSAETARTNTEWLEELGNGTKLIKPRFGVVVHRVPTVDFSIPGNEKDGIARIMEENDLAAKGYRVDEIAWLKKPDKPLGMYASMGIWLNTPDAAEWMVNNGLVFGQRYIGSIEHYQIDKKRCYRCQRFGHLARSCKERARCGHCSGDHERRNCPPGVRPKCLDCYGAHPTGDRNCQWHTRPPASR